MARSVPWRRTPPPETPDIPAIGSGEAGSLATLAEPASALHTASDVPAAPARARRGFTPWYFLLAAHPRQALLTVLALAGADAIAGRPARQVVLVLVTVLIGQTVLGWHNDLVDRRRDLLHGTARKPIADGRLESGTVWFALICAVLVLVPVAISNGLTAGGCYLASVLIGLVANIWPRRGLLSFLPWALAFALYPAFLSYAGWGGHAKGDPPEVAVVVLVALLGVGVHTLTALWGLVADDADGWTYLPLRVGRRWGSSRLLGAVAGYLVVVLGVLVVVVGAVGLSR